MPKPNSFLSALSETLKGNFVSEEVKKERLQKCYEPCENLIGTNCKKCLCFVEWKAALSSQTCPINKWT